MAKVQTLYVLVDETGVDLHFSATLREHREHYRAWLDMGAEPSTRRVAYTPTRAGVAALLNSLRQEGD